MAFKLRNPFGTRSVPSAKLLQAQALIEEGRLEQALLVLRELLASDPCHAEAWYKRANVHSRLNQHLEAVAGYQRAIELRPRHAPAHCNLGVVLLALGRTDAALSEFRQAIQIDPNDAITYYNRALLHEHCARWQEALSDYDQALVYGPALAQVHFQRGNVLARLQRWHDALTSFDAAVSIEPGHVYALFQRGNVLRELQQWDAAVANYDQVIALAPDHAEAHYNRAVVFELLKVFPEALHGFERAIVIRPDFVAAQYNRALLLLQTGAFSSGLAAYEWRWKNRGTGFDPAAYHGAAPLWSGQESLAGKRIFVFSEQGLGDTLQFSRYLKLLAGLGAHVVFEVQPPLAGLLAGIEGASLVIAQGDPVPPCDFKCALLSLPLAFKTTVDTIPSGNKYLHPDAATVDAWQARLGPRIRPRIGLVWSGSPHYPNDHRRSIPLATLIEHLPRECDYFCLQKDIREKDRATLDAHPFIVEPAADLVGTAALCECMDLVISSCTSIAHLAGALGKPLWVLLAYNADWRWLEDRDDSPWYPTAKLYRQAIDCDWGSVAARVATDLHKKFEPGAQRGIKR